MKKALVTGCAGFIGSHLTERLLQDGYQVIGIDGFVANYERAVKEQNLSTFLHHPAFQFSEAMLQEGRWDEWLDGVEVVYHQAALPGVRSSWGRAFAEYTDQNIVVTQRLLDACRVRPQIQKIVIASSSSVYGTMKDRMTNEEAPLSPLSPYGVTKRAMELLCLAYVHAYQLPVVMLRYFTVYGPRQRPDMAFHRFFQHMLKNESCTIYGDGLQSRDFTFVSDAVEANLLAAQHGKTGEIFNIGGNREVSLREVLVTMQQVTGLTLKLKYLPEQLGDSKRTCADITLAQKRLGYSPRVSLEAGLRQHFQAIARGERRDQDGSGDGLSPQLPAEE